MSRAALQLEPSTKRRVLSIVPPVYAQLVPYTIDKNVPLPPLATAARYPFVHLELEDSFRVWCKKDDQMKIQGKIGAAATAYGMRKANAKGRPRFTVRQRIEEGKPCVRCWRIA